MKCSPAHRSPLLEQLGDRRLLAGLVDFANLTFATACAEVDNVAVEVRPANRAQAISAFTVTTTHPVYDYLVDHRDPDFTNCSGDLGDDTLYSYAEQERKLFDDGNTAVWAVSEAAFWRPTAMTLRVGDEEATDVHYLRVIKKVADEDSWPEVLVFYTDGYLRLKPHAKPGQGDPIFGSSLQIGPSTDSTRPFADVREAVFDPSSDRLTVSYVSGETATLTIEHVNRSEARIRVTTDFPVHAEASTAVLRSMFVAPGNSDADHVSYVDADGATHDAAILEFLGAQATQLKLARNEPPSIHNTSAPDYLLSDFELDSPLPPVLLQFLAESAQRYGRSDNPSDAGNPVVFLFKDYFAGGAYTNISATGGLAASGLDGNHPDAARGTSSFRMTTSGASGYVEFGVANSESSPRSAAELGAVRAVRFWAKGDAADQALRVNVLRKTEAGAELFVVENVLLTADWAEYVVNMPATPVVALRDIYALQFQLPAAGTVLLDEVRLNTDGSDPLQLIQSYVPAGWAPSDSDITTAAGRDAKVYPNRSLLYDVALAAKALLAAGDAESRAFGLRQIDAVLATAPSGLNGYFNERSSGFVLLADGSVRPPMSQRRTVGDSAWFGLALLDAFRSTGNERYLTRAREITDWFDRELKAALPLAGYFGGYDDEGNAIAWRATEFNVDAFELNRQIAAILTERGDSSSAATYAARADYAATFVLAMFDDGEGKFWTGTTSGDTINQSSVPLDAQLWPVLTLAQSDAYAAAIDWSRPIQYVEAHLTATDEAITGVRFSTGATEGKVWAEGVAQSAAVYQVLGETAKQLATLNTLVQMHIAGSGVMAVSSGTMTDPHLASVYDARLAIAPTAWSYFAHQQLNPFAANNVSPPPVAYRNGDNAFDVDANGRVNAQDLRVLLVYLIRHGNGPPSGIRPPYVDVAAPDDMVNLRDVIAELKFLLTRGGEAEPQTSDASVGGFERVSSPIGSDGALPMRRGVSPQQPWPVSAEHDGRRRANPTRPDPPMPAEAGSELEELIESFLPSARRWRRRR